MAQRRMIRILSYEGNEEWLEHTLSRSPFKTRRGHGDTLFYPKGTIRELHRIEMQEGEDFEDALVRTLGAVGIEYP